MIVTLVQAGIFLLYLLFVIYKVGIPPSISDSWYMLERKHKPFFTILFCYPIGVLNCTHGNVWFFVAGAGLCFVGAATDFKSDWKYTAYVHGGGAVIAIVGSLAGLIAFGIWWPALATVAFVGTLAKKENSIWWIEIAAFVFVIGGLIQYYW